MSLSAQYAALSGTGVTTVGTTYSADQVYAMMLTSRQETFSFDWLNQDGVYQGDLSPYIVEQSAVLSHDAAAALSRSLTFRTLGKPAALNPLSDRIRVHYLLRAPDGGWLDWTLATLLLNPPRKSISEAYSLYDWTATDIGDLLVQDKFQDSFSLAGGTDALQGVRGILGSLIGPQPLLLAVSNRPLNLRDSIAWDRGKSKLAAIDDLLDAVGFRWLWFDEQSRARTVDLPDYNLEVAPWTWDATAGQSVVVSAPLTEEPDMSNVCNVCVAVGEDPRAHTPIVATYENSRPDSPVSTTRLRRRLVQTIQDTKLATYDAAMARAREVVQRGARIYAKFTVETFGWPAWADGGYQLIHLPYYARDEGTVDANYLVSGWSWPLVAGGTTTHTLQRVVPA